MKFRDFGFPPPAEGFSPPAKILQRATYFQNSHLAAGENISPPAKPLSPPAENFSPPAKIPQFPKFHFFQISPRRDYFRRRRVSSEITFSELFCSKIAPKNPRTIYTLRQRKRGRLGRQRERRFWRREGDFGEKTWRILRISTIVAAKLSSSRVFLISSLFLFSATHLICYSWIQLRL